MASLFDERVFNERLFFPRRDLRPPPEGAEDLRVEAADGAGLQLRAHKAKGARGALLLFTGNGEAAPDWDQWAARFRLAGAALLASSYRGYGASEGRPTLRAALADAGAVAGAAAAWARARGLPLIVMGRSLGSMCAAELCRARPPLAVGFVVESGVADLAGLVRRRGLEPPARFDPADVRDFDPLPKHAASAAPLLVLHGEDDEVVAPDEARATLAASGAADKRLVMVPGGGHNDLMGERAYWRELAAFVARVGGGASTG